MTVCTAEACKEYVNVGKTRERKLFYPQISHDRCYPPGIPVGTTNNEQLRDCGVMSDGKCQKWGHDYRVHMDITYTTTLVQKELLPVDAEKKVKLRSHLSRSRKEAFIAGLEKRIKKLEEEKSSF